MVADFVERIIVWSNNLLLNLGDTEHTGIQAFWPRMADQILEQLPRDKFWSHMQDLLAATQIVYGLTCQKMEEQVRQIELTATKSATVSAIQETCQLSNIDQRESSKPAVSADNIAQDGKEEKATLTGGKNYYPGRSFTAISPLISKD